LGNLGKIGPVDVQIIGLIKIVKKETTAERISHLRLVGRKLITSLAMLSELLRQYAMTDKSRRHRYSQ